MSGLKRRIIVGLGILLIGLSAFLAYRYFFGKTLRSSFDAISEESLLLLRADDPVGFWNGLVSQKFWKEMTTIPAVRHAESMLVGLDSLAGQQGRLQKFLKNKSFLASLQPVGKDEMDWLFVLEASDEALKDFWSIIESNTSNRYVSATRLYSDVEIREIKAKDGSRRLSIARIDNLVILSFTSFLLEEAIRNVQSESIANLRDIYGDRLFENQDSVTLILTKAGVQGFASVLGKEGRGEVLEGWPEKLAVVIHPKIDGSEIRFAGELYSDPSFPTEVSDSSEASWSNWLHLVPNSAASFRIFNFDHASKLAVVMGKNLVLNPVVSGELENKLIGKGFLEGFTGMQLAIEMGQSFSDRRDRILVFQTDSAARQTEMLRDFVIGIAEGMERSNFVDFYRGREIFLIDLDQFPSHLFRANFSGFPNTFITVLEGNIVIANSNSVLKRYLDEMDSGSGKSITSTGFPSENSDISQVQTYWELDFSNTWPTWMDFVSPSWAAFFQKYAAVAFQFEKLSLQVSASNSSHILTGKVSYRDTQTGAEQQLAMHEIKTVSFEEALTFGPKALRNFVDASLEFLVQDRLDRVRLITEEGEEVFSKVLDGPIVSDIFQIDYYKNNKLQLLFATGNTLYAVDRLGEFLPGFPVNIPTGNISYLNLVDYENDRNYRYFLASPSGEIYLLDREGKPLDGWNPKVISDPIVSNPTHFRVPGLGDRMFVIDRRGHWHLFNRRGEYEPGAPFKLADEILTQYAIREGTSAKETRIVTVSPNGEVVMANFRGEITERTQLPRPDRESSFHLVKDPNNEKYVLIVQEFNQLSVMDESYQTLFSQRIDAEDLAFQYFHFGSSYEILVVIDRLQEFIYLYDLAGKMLLERPLPGTLPISITLPPGKNEYAVFSIHGRQWMEYRLPL
jgi:hypothetical protein